MTHRQFKLRVKLSIVKYNLLYYNKCNFRCSIWEYVDKMCMEFFTNTPEKINIYLDDHGDSDVFLYVKLSEENYLKVEKLHLNLGISMSLIIRSIIDHHFKEVI